MHDGANPVQAGHRQVGDHDIDIHLRPGLIEPLASLLAVAAARNDVEVRLGVEGVTQRLTSQVVVLGHQHPDHHRSRLPRPRRRAVMNRAFPRPDTETAPHRARCLPIGHC